MSKSEGLAKLTNAQGKITIAALDHRGSLKQELHPENPDLTTDQEILAWKRRMVELFRGEVAGILLDPIYGSEIVDRSAKTGWMISMEKTGYRGGKEARVTEILPDWSVAQAKAMGACSVKLLLYFDPENSELAQKQKKLAEQIAEDCIREDLVFLLEPLSYKIESDRESEVLKIATELKDIKADIFKFEYPGTKAACQEITQMMRVPWVLLSAGMEYAKYKAALIEAMEAGAAGFAVGRAVWQEFGKYHDEERERYLNEVALPRMRELVQIVSASGKKKLRLVEQAEVAGKRVIVRVDWNVTLGKALQIVDDTRIVRTLPTIEYLLKQGAKQIILMAHLGKPGGKPVKELTLAPIVQYASKLLGKEIVLKQTSSECLYDKISQVMILENLRFAPGEEVNDPSFVQELAGLGEIYVNEAFGEAHRRVASIVGIPRIIPGYAGRWFQEEVETLNKVRENPARPYVVLMGGAKVEDKIKLIEVLAQTADTILLGGKLANEYVQRGIKIKGKARIITPLEGSKLFDIGFATKKLYAGEIMKAKTVVWNGPMGMVEDSQYRKGTEAIYEAIYLNESAYTVVGGGDTLSAIGKDDHLGRIDHVSTGGGAMLKLLEAGSLPGIEVLESRP